MKTLQEYWSEDQINDSTERKLQSVELDAKKALLDAKHDLASRESAFDSYLVALQDAPAIHFENIVEHVNGIENSKKHLATTASIYNALFNPNNTSHGS
ncbi:MAG: hypothetical protein ACPH5P_00110 [Akkermansiaceae bacterium]